MGAGCGGGGEEGDAGRTTPRALWYAAMEANGSPLLVHCVALLVPVELSSDQRVKPSPSSQTPKQTAYDVRAPFTRPPSQPLLARNSTWTTAAARERHASYPADKNPFFN